MAITTILGAKQLIIVMPASNAEWQYSLQTAKSSVVRMPKNYLLCASGNCSAHATACHSIQHQSPTHTQARLQINSHGQRSAGTWLQEFGYRHTIRHLFYVSRAFAAICTTKIRVPTSNAALVGSRANSATHLHKSSLMRARGAQCAALQSIVLYPAPAPQASLIVGPHET